MLLGRHADCFVEANLSLRDLLWLLQSHLRAAVLMLVRQMAILNAMRDATQDAAWTAAAVANIFVNHRANYCAANERCWMRCCPTTVRLLPGNSRENDRLSPADSPDIAPDIAPDVRRKLRR